jgi:hypothetical protein
VDGFQAVTVGLAETAGGVARCGANLSTGK